jgi:ABC-type transport system substrate-binding protein
MNMDKTMEREQGERKKHFCKIVFSSLPAPLLSFSKNFRVRFSFLSRCSKIKTGTEEKALGIIGHIAMRSIAMYLKRFGKGRAQEGNNLSLKGFSLSHSPLSTSLLAALLLVGMSCFGERVLYSAAGGRVKTLDPVKADDLASRNMAGSIFDTLLQYDYTARPYKLIPSMLSEMPEVNAAGDRFRFKLRDDLYFAADAVFKSQSERKITSRDIIYSFLRFADSRNHSPVYWMFRGKIRGLDEFHRKSQNLAAGDFSLYDVVPEGFRILDERCFEIILSKPDPRFLYMLALPNAGIVSRKAVEYYGGDFARHPVGSGAFVLKEWIRECRLVLERNPSYRTEYFPQAENPADRKRPLPLSDRVVFLLVKQPMTAWLLFLQGRLHMNGVDKDNSDLIVGGELPPDLKKRGIKLLRMPEFEIRYVGFNFADPVLGKNLKLRQALSLAYNVSRRVQHSGNQLLPAQGPIPPGVAGHDENFRNPFAADDLEKAKKLLAEAGYPGGIDPATGKRLRFTFDQSGNSSAHRQYGELAAADFAKLGIEVESVLNNNARFYEKLRQGKLQMFRLSWVGDFPDAENFLQLFYSGNAGGCNRTGFADPVYDRMYEKILSMPDTPERTRYYEEMVQYLTKQVPWIFEGFPLSYQLNHAGLQNYLPHDFAFGRYKYLVYCK